MSNSYHDYLKLALRQCSARKMLQEALRQHSVCKTFQDQPIAAKKLVDDFELMFTGDLEHPEDRPDPSDILPDTFPDAAL